MKLICALIVCTLGLSTAEEHPRGKMIQVCGAELARALERVCEFGDLDFTNQKHVHHHHQHDHDHQHDRAHHHDHQHDHQHHESKRHVMKREISLSSECCLKPCHIKDLASYCPDNS